MEDWDDRKDVRHGRVAMRHGHRKGLDVPKRGKAAIRAEIQGQGPEVFRGRSAFRRSFGRPSRCYSPEYRGKYGSMWIPVRRRRHLRSETWKDAAEVNLPCLEMEEDSDADVDATDSAEEFLDKSEQSCCDMSETETESNWSFVSCGGSCSTTASRVAFADFKAAKEATAWDLALLRAEAGALIYAAYLLEHGQFRVAPQNKAPKTRTARQPRPMDVEAKLRQQFCTTVYWNSQGPVKTQRGNAAKHQPFDEFRRKFLQVHGLRFCSMLQSVFHGPVSLRPTPLSQGVQDNFLLATKILSGELIPTYHGTAMSNLRSIYQRGLLIPRENGNDIRVANGSAHGLGIYTAKVDSPHLSWGFAKGSKTLLIYGVLDDAVPTNAAASGTYGSFGLKAESESIRHVGDAVVIFDSRRVAPLFVATSEVPAPKPSQVHRKPPPHQGPRTRLRKKRDQTQSLREMRLVAFLARRGAMKRRP